MVTRGPLTRYWFIDQLARQGMLSSIQDGWISRRLHPHGPPSAPAPEPRPHSEIVRERDEALRAAFRQGDCTHEDPRDARAARRHMLAYWDSKG